MNPAGGALPAVAAPAQPSASLYPSPSRSVLSVPSLTSLFRPAFEELLAQVGPHGEVVHTEVVPARPARTVAAADALVPPLGAHVVAALAPERLWVHQAEAIRHVLGGRSVVVATGTASGKSLCYQLPIAAAAEAGAASALLLFPTKALAQDQLRALAELGTRADAAAGRTRPRLVVSAYDGDTAPDARAWARRHANTVLTNPDMLHQGILPFHARWKSFFANLRYVVIDELHTYRGIFGSHVAHVLRRLRRVCELYGSSPVFVCTSATIGDPAGLAAELCGTAVTCVDDDGSPQGERLLAVWNPPLDADGLRASGNTATAKLLAACVDHGYRTIAFTRSRRATELVAARAQRAVDARRRAKVRPYRGGFLAAERREIEAQFMRGELLGIAATNALELGVDIGGLDVCVVNGFPGTISSFRQQIGRAGRSAQRSLAVLVTGDDALDQWYAAHPQELVRRPPEPSVVNPANPFVCVPQTACAVHEVPLRPGDVEPVWHGAAEAVDDAVRRLVTADQVTLVNGRAVWSGRGSPAARVSLRSGSGGEVRIVRQDRRELPLVGTVDGGRARSTLHEGALYLHQGQQYRVRRLDLADSTAWVEAVEVDEYTQARSDTAIRILAAEQQCSVGRFGLALGAVEVTEQVVGFQTKRISTNEVLGETPLELDPTLLVTRAFWYDVPDDVLDDAGLAGAAAACVPGTVHAAEHAGIGILPLFTICDRWDVGGVSMAAHPQTGRAVIIVYDGYPGGAGIAELGYAAGAAHARATLDAIRACPCADGCPSCVQSPKCGNGNDPLDKHGAVALLTAGLGV